jgi:predicted RNA-binding Zn ribbon-like protein
MAETATAGGPERIAGSLALEFTNTLGGARGGATQETLHGFGDLLRWARDASAVDAGRAGRMAAQAAAHPRRAAAAFRRALAVREAIFAAVRAAVERRPAKDADRALLERAHAEATHALTLAPRPGGGYALKDRASADAPADLVAPIVRDAVALLLDPARLTRVRVCAGATCTWLFLDPTKNRSRRWCEMKSCGNREKARRHRARAKDAG